MNLTTTSHPRLDRLERECAGATSQALALAVALSVLVTLLGLASILG